MQRRTGVRLERSARLHCRVVYVRQELIAADPNLNEIDREFLTLDVSGTTRSDVFKFENEAE